MRSGVQSMCGCFYLTSPEVSRTREYLPQVDLKAHTTIISTSQRTVLTQTFVNPSSTVNVKECIYVFPLYDGVSVVGFTCQVGPRIINGLVKEKVKAKEEYDAAVERGQTAGLLEQAATSDVFMTSLGNIPAGEKMLVTITYIGELNYDANTIRFTIPTRISPRYGHSAMSENDSTVSKGGIAITVDINMPENSTIQEIRSPSHPSAVTVGRTSAGESQPPHLSRASATLSLGTSTLDRDYVLEIGLQDSGKSRALLETHPTILGQRAIMATFILDASVQQSKPEVIFVADQSGSMQGPRTVTLINALRIFLKSLPVGIKFNICYFGSSHSFLFPESQVYDQNSLEKALRSVNGLNGGYGGTETLEAVKASIKSRDSGQPLSLILATDGDIWQQQELFDYLNDSVAASKKSLRVFALGIGNSVSSSLIQGVARAGNGFAQSVLEDEKLHGKLIRMLRGALTPDHGALTMEIQYQKHHDDENEYVMIERVSDSLCVLELDDEGWTDVEMGAESAISAETTAAGRKDVETSDADGQARYKDLAAVPAPKLLQTPQNIPPLYPFNRTNVYVLIAPEVAQGTIKSVILKGTTAENKFELEVPIEILPEGGETIHQLAAKKAINELEQGRGWLVHAKDEKGVLIKETHSGRFQSMVEREAVRLGIQYQIAGKFTSFVATEKDPDDPKNTVLGKFGIVEGAKPVPLRNTAAISYGAPSSRSFGGELVELENLSATTPRGNLFSAPVSRGLPSNFASIPTSSEVPSAPASSGLFGSNLGSILRSSGTLFGSSGSTNGSVFGFSAPGSGGLSSNLGSNMRSSSALFSASGSTNVSASARRSTGGMAPRKQLASTSVPKNSLYSLCQAQDTSADDAEDSKTEETQPLQKIIMLQTFEGYWNLDAPLLEIVGLSAQHMAPQDFDSKMWATVLAITFLEEKLAGEKESWVMVVEKARDWLKDMKKGEEGSLKEKWQLAKKLITAAAD